jgi:uncharacterized protein YqgC (DUF456 family)
MDIAGGSIYDLLFGNVWDGKQTQQSIDMGQKKDLGFFGNLFNYNRGFNNPAPKRTPKPTWGGGRADGGPVDVGPGYDGTLTYLEGYTDPATRFIHQVLQGGSSNSNLARFDFIETLASLYGAGIKSIMPGPDLADALRNLVGSGKLPGPLEALASSMLGLSQLSNVTAKMGLRDTYELDPGLDIVRRGIWDRGSRPLSTSVVRSVVGGLAGDYEHLGGILSQQRGGSDGDATGLMSMGGVNAPISLVTRAGYKPPHVTTSFNDFLSGDYHFPYFVTDPGSFPDGKRGLSLSGTLPAGGKGASRLSEFQIPGGIPIDQVEAIFGLNTMVDEPDRRRPLNETELKARAALFAKMGFTDLGNHAVATDILQQQIAEWRSSTSADAVDPVRLAEAKAEIIRQQEMGRILAGREAQAASLLRAGVFTSIDEAALYAATADDHFKGVRARKVDAEAQRRSAARTVPRNLSFEEKLAAIRERLLFTQPELFPEIGAEATPLKMFLDDAPTIPKVAGEQLDLFSEYKKPPKLDDLVEAHRQKMALVSLRVGEGLAGRPAQRTTQGDRRPGLLQSILGKIPGVGKIISAFPLFDYAKNQAFNNLTLGTDKFGMPIGYNDAGAAADTISFDWGDVRIPHELVGKMTAPQLDRLSQGMRLALSAAPFGMFDPSDPGKRILVDVVDSVSAREFSARVPRLQSNYIQVQRQRIFNDMPDAAIHEVGHLMHNRKYSSPKILLELFKPSNIKETVAALKNKTSMFALMASMQEAMVMNDHVKAYERSLIAQGLDPMQAEVEASSRPIGVSPENWTRDAYKMPIDFPRPTIYSGSNPLEHFAEIFLGKTQESLPDSIARRTLPITAEDARRGSHPSGGQLLDLDYDRVSAELAGKTLTMDEEVRLRTAAARSQYAREIARTHGFRTIRDPGAVAAGLMPELYTSQSRRIPVPLTGGKLNLKGMQTWTPNQGGFKGGAAKADSFVGTKKGNFLTGFLADVAMMASTGNFNFAQLIPSLGFNLLSILPKIGGPAAMVAGLLTTGATGGDMGRAMAGTVGSLVGGLLGNLIPIPFIGGMIGSILGGMLGDFIYTNFINPESANKGTQMIQAGGGAVYNVGPNAPFPFNGPSNVPFSGEPLRKVGGRAFGGAVRPNVGYMVGERGPELLVPGGLGGSIIPNHKMRGPQGVSAVAGGQTVNASVVINNPSVSNAGDIDKLAKKVAEAQTRALRSAGYARPS